MPLSFAQAYAMVCPNGEPVVPLSKEYEDIMELMRQSGHKNFRETLVQDSAPRKPATVEEAMPFIETRQILEKPLKISKQRWMAVEANRQKFLTELNKNKTTA
jgi:hypothetical protein